MKSKKEFLILGLVIIALGAYLAIRKTDRTHYELPAISPIKGGEITSIRITKGKDIIELKKIDDKWLIQPEKFPAETGKIDAMLKIIQNLAVTALVSESPDDARYELDPGKRISVTASKDSKPLRSFDIGKPAPSGRHTFIKLSGDAKIYYAAENFRSIFDETKDQLRDKVVLTVDRNQVHQIAIKDKDDKMLLDLKQVPETPAVTPEVKPGAKTAVAPPKTPAAPAPSAKMIWKNADDKPVNESDINNLFANLSRLQCQSFINGKTKADFTKPLYTVTLSGAKTITLSVFDKLNKDDATYPAVSSENDYPFMLPAYMMDSMVKKNENNPNPNPGPKMQPKSKP